MSILLEEDKLTTADIQKARRKQQRDEMYASAVDRLINSFTITDKVFDIIDTNNAMSLANWDIKSKTVNQDGLVKQLFTERVGKQQDGIFNMVIGNKANNAGRVIPQRIKFRKDVLRDDFVNYWGNNMLTHPNERVASAFKEVMGKDTVSKRAMQGEFSMQDIVDFYESKEYKLLVSDGIVEGGQGLAPWMNDIASISNGGEKGLKGYVHYLAEKNNLSPSDVHYMLTRDGGYAVLPNVDKSKDIGFKVSNLDNDEIDSLDPRQWSDYNQSNLKLHNKDAIEGISIGDDGNLSVDSDFYGSDEFYNLPPQFQDELEIMQATNPNVSSYMMGTSNPYPAGQGPFDPNNPTANLSKVPVPSSGVPVNTKPGYFENIGKSWKDKGTLGKASTALSVASSVQTLADEDADNVEKGLAVASLGAEAAAANMLGSAAASLSWMPYVGPTLALASMVYGATKKDNKSGPSEAQVQKQENEDFMKDILERQYA